MIEEAFVSDVSLSSFSVVHGLVPIVQYNNNAQKKEGAEVVVVPVEHGVQKLVQPRNSVMNHETAAAVVLVLVVVVVAAVVVDRVHRTTGVDRTTIPAGEIAREHD